jgi:hypothetical protein
MNTPTFELARPHAAFIATLEVDGPTSQFTSVLGYTSVRLS